MNPSLDTLGLPADQVRTDAEAFKVYGKDWTSYFDINAAAVVFPKTVEDVVRLVQWARQNRVGLIPSGGRTGLSGAACATAGEVVVSFEKMDKILNFNPVDQTVTCQPGLITENLQKFAMEKGLYYPVDFAARGSSQVGGNVATNAGGIKVLRYGMTREWVAGLKVVTGAGEVLDLNNGLIKNATGYDLRHLFIGSEGTLGFVVEVTFRLAAPPPPSTHLMLGVPDLDAIMKIFSEFKRTTSILAFEMFAGNAVPHLMKSTGLPRPLESESPYYLVIEVENRSAAEDEIILGVFERCLEQGWVADGAIAQNETQIRNFWRYREDITESLSSFTPYKNDISVTIARVPQFMRDLDTIFKTSYPTWEVVWFGHIGDGNLHISILRPVGMSKEEFVKECRKVDEILFSMIQRHHGSISAEHGVGLTKKPFLHFTRSAAEIELMRGIKKTFDPDLIMNPGKVFEVTAPC